MPKGKKIQNVLFFQVTDDPRVDLYSDREGPCEILCLKLNVRPTDERGTDGTGWFGGWPFGPGLTLKIAITRAMLEELQRAKLPG